MTTASTADSPKPETSTSGVQTVARGTVATRSGVMRKKRQRSQETCRCGLYGFPHRKVTRCENSEDSTSSYTKSLTGSALDYAHGVGSLFKNNDRM
jgi:hypothetical protein